MKRPLNNIGIIVSNVCVGLPAPSVRSIVLGWLIKVDAFVKSRHSGEPRIGSGAGTGVQLFCKSVNKLDSGFRRNDGKWAFGTFYESVKFNHFDFLVVARRFLAAFP